MIGTLLADVLTIRAALIIGASVRVIGSLSFWRLGVGREDQPAEA